MAETIKLAPDLKISRVLTGLWQIADREKDGEMIDRAQAAMRMGEYAAAGLTTFDMADHYGSAEVIAGYFRQKKSPEQDVQLFTKWVPRPGVVTKQEVREAVLKSLERLATDRLDLLQYHAWNYADPAWLDSLFWLQELKEEGLIAHLGLTNFDAAHLRVAVSSGIEILSNQVSYSVLDQRAAAEMTKVCLEFDVRLFAFGTLAGGFLSEKWLDQPEPSQPDSMSRQKYKRYIDVVGGWDRFQLLLRNLSSIASRRGVSVATLCSRYILEQPAVAGVILGSGLTGQDYLEEKVAISDLSLDEQDLAEVSEAIDHLDAVPGGCGDEYRKPPFLTATGDLSDHLNSMPDVFAPVKSDNGKARVFSGTSWEDFAGYCRAVRSGDRIHVSGTTATHGDRLIGGEDPAAQTHFVIDKIQAAIESLGGRLEDIDRTRIFVNNVNDWEQVAKAHGERFGSIQPANTLVEARLVGAEYLVEIEAEASLGTR
jgi:aryl-alcohol dehydrogenase-like predicted oxidoreductase